eukprot:7387587-Prymnesium_polylepis.1
MLCRCGVAAVLLQSTGIQIPPPTAATWHKSQRSNGSASTKLEGELRLIPLHGFYCWQSGSCWR